MPISHIQGGCPRGRPLFSRDSAFTVCVKTLDALHVASALILAEKLGDESPVLVCHDEGMNRWARVLGFSVPLAG
jgi:hypothetical protein